MKATQNTTAETQGVRFLNVSPEVLIRTRVINLRRNQISKCSNSVKEMTQKDIYHLHIRLCKHN
jgi:hypothetical protein